ncbi:type II toxin-antitoxin system RelE/ParE family toxin [Comamonas aquatica]|nr:type II toxin-antitoxin system RelE/ParE family toxin [Comamonas aquatica]
MEQESCPAVDFLTNEEANTKASRSGLLVMLQHVAANGFDNIPALWSHEVNKKEGIYEFIKGPLRLFYFKGEGNCIAVCTGGARKKGQKVDKASVDHAIRMKAMYWDAVKSGKLEIQKDEDHTKT